MDFEISGLNELVDARAAQPRQLDRARYPYCEGLKRWFYVRLRTLERDDRARSSDHDAAFRRENALSPSMKALSIAGTKSATVSAWPYDCR